MSVVNALVEIFQSSGFVSLSWQNWVMILVSFVLLYLAIVKKFEPLLLVPIAFGMLLVNIYPDIMYDPLMMSSYSGQVVEGAHWYDTGVLRLIYAGVKSTSDRFLRILQVFFSALLLSLVFMLLFLFQLQPTLSPVLRALLLRKQLQ